MTKSKKSDQYSIELWEKHSSATVFEVDQQEIRRQGEHVEQLKRRLDEIRNKQEIIRKNIDLFNADLKQMKEQVPIGQIAK